MFDLGHTPRYEVKFPNNSKSEGADTHALFYLPLWVFFFLLIFEIFF